MRRRIESVREVCRAHDAIGNLLRGPSIAEQIDVELDILNQEELGVNTFDHKRYELLLFSLNAFKQWFYFRRGYWLGN